MHIMSNKYITFCTDLLAKLSSFGRHEGGAFAIYMGFAMIPLVGFMGISTDAARAYLVKSRLSSAIDAAGLAGGKVYYAPHRDDDIRMYFNANFPANYMGSTLTGPEIIANEDKETLTLRAFASVPMMFMHMFGFDNVTVTASNETTRKMIALDAVLAIDMSGSMGTSLNDTTRIGAARDASNDLIEILFGDNTEKDLLNFGLVPWNGKVNVTLNDTVFDPDATTEDAVAPFTNPINALNQSALFYAANSPAPLLSRPEPDWKGCVYNRFINDGNEFTNADVLMPPEPTRDADWYGWEPIGPEGEPANGDGSALKILQTKSTSNYGNSLAAAWDQTPKDSSILIAIGSRREGAQFYTPAGWTSLASINANDGMGTRRSRIFAKRAGVTEAGIVLTAGNSRQQAMTILEVNGLAWNGIIDNIRITDHTENQNTSVSLNSVSTNNDGDLLLAVAALEDDDFDGFAWSNNFTQLGNVEEVSGDSADLTHAVAYKIVSNDGSYSTTFSTTTGGAEETWGAIIALEASHTCSGTVSGGECTPCLSHGITPLQNSKAVISAAVDSLQTPIGTTNITQGLGWAWRVVKPGMPFSEAITDPDYTRQQAIILLTDGENFAGNGDGYKTIFGNGSIGRPNMNLRLQQIAANIKADGVTLYVIQFAHDGTDLQELLKGVASGPGSPYYHFAPDADALKKVFKEIANHLSELRLSK